MWWNNDVFSIVKYGESVFRNRLAEKISLIVYWWLGFEKEGWPFG